MAKSTPLPDHNALITTRELCQLHRIDEEARALATKGRPPREQTMPSRVEHDVEEHIRTRIARRQNEHHAEVESIGAAIAALPDPRTDRNLRDLEQHVVDSIMAVFTLHTPEIRPAVAAERNTKAAYNAWRDEHRRISDPCYPASRIEHFALIFAVCLLEAVITSGMYIAATPHGIIGAIAIATTISACTIGLGVAVGLGPLRYLNRPEPAVRKAAIAALVVLLPAITFISLFAAHYRELAVADPTTFNERQVLPHLLAEPFVLSLQSYVLFMLGLLFATIAAFKGYGASDPYPGYEPQDRIYQPKLDNLNDLTATIRGAIDAVYQKEIVFVADKPVHAQALLDDINRRHKALQFAQARRLKLDELDVDAGEGALRHFRTLNRDIRTDGVEPVYFANAPTLTKLLGSDEPDPNSFSAELDRLVADATETHIKHRDAYAALITTCVQHIERAKTATEKIMATIEASHVDAAAIPDLAELRSLITGRTPPKEEHPSWSPHDASKKPSPNGAASGFSQAASS